MSCTIQCRQRLYANAMRCAALSCRMICAYDLRFAYGVGTERACGGAAEAAVARAGRHRRGGGRLGGGAVGAEPGVVQGAGAGGEGGDGAAGAR
eukprot:2707973-Rhodomonas_salina.1